MNKNMIVTVTVLGLSNIIQDLPGWHNLQVSYLREYNGKRYYNVHLTKKQVAELGAAKILASYQATEYKAFQEQENHDRPV